MKNNKWYLAGMAALALVFGLMMAGCEQPTDDDEGGGGGSSKSTAKPLTLDTWVDGNIPTVDSGGAREQWFTFTATAATQYIYIQYSTLTSLYVQVYDSSNYTVGEQARFWSSLGDTSISRALTSGATYYIKVTPGSSSSGTYRIGFTGFPAQPGTTFTQLTLDTWADGNIALAYCGGLREQWFEFTATVATQYIHIKFSTMTSLSVQVYDSSVYTVGSQASLSGSTGGTDSTSRELTSGATYYIKVTPQAYSSASGTYRIGFTTSAKAP
jgi:hypothetical protein